MSVKKLNTIMGIITVLLCSLDLWVKHLILKTFNDTPYPDSSSISVIGDFFQLTYVQNFGITFGLLTDLPIATTRTIIVVICIAALYVLSYFYKHIREFLQDKVTTFGYICLSVILGGALGNIIDRMLNGFVVDYLDFGIGIYRWYTFNLADVFIVVGCLTLTFLMSFFEDKTQKK